jgi:hypothetical protein
MSIIEFDLCTMTFLSMDKPNKEWIIVPPTNSAAFVICVAIRSFCSFFFLKIKCWRAFMIYVFPILTTPPTYCNICLLEFICVNVSNA